MKHSSSSFVSRTMLGLYLICLMFLMPLQLFSQEAEISDVVTETVESSIDDASEVQEELEDDAPRLVQPEEIGPSLDKAIQKGEQKSSLEELLAVPFDQVKDGGERDETDGDIDEAADNEKGELPEPTEPQQSLAEKNLEEKLDILLQEMLPQEYVGTTVSIKYFIETVPVSKNLKRISKIKLPGFDNHVWVPTKSKQIVGIVNQTRSYTTVFVVVNTPISPFNIEVLRQSLSEKLKEINLLKDDVLKVVYVPHAASDQVGITAMNRNAEIPEKAEPSSSGNIESGTLPQSEMLPGLAKLEMSGSSEEELEEIRKKKKRQKKLDEIDMAMKMETTRYLLKARTSYQQEDFDSAITAISDAIEVNPFSPQAYEMLGSIYYRLGWNGMAVENWQHALKLDPSNETLKKYISRVAK